MGKKCYYLNEKTKKCCNPKCMNSIFNEPYCNEQNCPIKDLKIDFLKSIIKK